MKLTEIKYQYIFSGSYVRCLPTSKCIIGKNVTIRNSRILLAEGAYLNIADNAVIENVSLYVINGECIIGKRSIIRGANTKKMIFDIESGAVKIADHTKVLCKRIWTRFNGKLSIGSYTNINSDSEIRCDEKVEIGSFNQISYGVRIWDTNTHQKLSPEERRKVTIEKFPSFGYESARPETEPVFIGDDCWIGENATIMKGSNIGNKATVGYGALIIGKRVDEGKTAVTKSELKIF